MSNLSATSIASAVITIVALIASILSLAIDRWGQFTITVGSIVTDTHYGLINLCPCALGNCLCVKFADQDDVPAFRKACLAAICLAFIGNLVALFTMIMWILNIGSVSVTKMLKVVTIALLAIAVFWNAIAVIVFAAMDKKEVEKDGEKGGITVEDYKLGWAWGMAILAAILQLAGIITTGMSQKSD